MAKSISTTEERVRELEREKERALQYLGIMGVPPGRCKGRLVVGLQVLESRLAKENRCLAMENADLQMALREAREALADGHAMLSDSIPRHLPPWERTRERMQAAVARIDALAAEQKAEPIPMVLHCPQCGSQHIDAPSGEWTNPPHKSHLCSGCGAIWRPADVPTTGVAAVATRGKADTWPKPASDALPLMARREWMMHGSVYVIQQADGTIAEAFDLAMVDLQGRAVYRIADTDEHGLPVVPREKEMPEWVKYQTVNDKGAVLSAFGCRPTTWIGTLQCVEGYWENNDAT